MDNLKLSDKEKINLAIFDFDGTFIPAQSGLKLTQYLFSHNQLSIGTVIKLIIWGIKYKIHLPYREDYPRELIFSAFDKKDVDVVNDFIGNFYEEIIDPLVYKQLIDISNKVKNENNQVIVLSAAFYPVLQCFAKKYNIEHFIGTKMKIDNNCYINKVDGYCVAGSQKMKYLNEYANKVFGKSNWQINYAFADHYTDKEVLKNAKVANAVNPDETLKIYAKKHNWNILNIG